MRLLLGLLGATCALAVTSCSASDELSSGSVGDEPSADADAGLESGESADVADAGAEDHAEAAVPDSTSDLVDASQEADSDGDPSDVPLDADVDVFEEPPPATSKYCGDAIRDPILEECDDGLDGDAPADLCTDACEVRELLVAPSAAPDASPVIPPGHSYGSAAHPVAGGATGLGVVLVDEAMPQALDLAAFDPLGKPGAIVSGIEAGTYVDVSSSPVVAALPLGRFAVAWSDLAKQSVALRVVEPSTSYIGPLTYANAIDYDAQVGPDLLWTGTELVVVWHDGAGGDVKVRQFSADLAPSGSESVLAGTPDAEDLPVLASWGSSWAAAWVVSQPFAIPPASWVAVGAGGATWSLGGVGGVVAGRPALTALDATHLLAVWSSGGGIQGSIIDTTASLVSSPIVIASATSDALDEPALASSGDVVELAFRSTAGGLPSTRDVWLKEMRWSSSTSTLDTSRPAMPLPRDPSHRIGEQGQVALGPVPLIPGGAVAATWCDRGGSFAGTGKEDVVVTLLPTPVVRISASDAAADQ
jgi:hypothetical protein